MSRRWTELKANHRWIRHVVDAYARFNDNNGGQYAAAITYFSFLALFPLVLLAVSITGFVLHADPQLQVKLLDKVASSFPGGFGDTLRTSINSAINARTGLGITGLIGVLLTGLGWIGNLRQAIDGVWGTKPPKQNFVLSKVNNLLVLAGLGIGALVSLGLTAVGTALTDQIVRGLGLDGVFGIHYITKILGIAVAVLGDMLIFGWLLLRLPRAKVPRWVAFRGLLMVSIGFEILKIAGTFTIAKSSHSATAGPFASIVAVLIWVQLVARWLLFCAAWLATSVPDQPPPAPAVSLAKIETVSVAPGFSPARVAVSLVGAGAALGGGAVAWLATRQRLSGHRDAGDPEHVAARDAQDR